MTGVADVCSSDLAPWRGEDSPASWAPAARRWVQAEWTLELASFRLLPFDLQFKPVHFRDHHMFARLDRPLLALRRPVLAVDEDEPRRVEGRAGDGASADRALDADQRGHGPYAQDVHQHEDDERAHGSRQTYD